LAEAQLSQIHMQFMHTCGCVNMYTHKKPDFEAVQFTGKSITHLP